MIVASLLLILVAVTLLVLGLADGSSQLLVASIGASLVAAIALVIGARQAAATRAALDEERDAGEPDLAHLGARERVAAGAPAGPPRRAGTGEAAGMTGAAAGTATADTSTESFPTVPPPAEGAGARTAPAGAATAPADAAPSYADLPDADLPGADPVDDEEDPPDEPTPQRVSAADTARVARMSTDVLVIDGRPRYHLAGCVHLLGRDSEPLPVAEAIELGFTPCGLCEPVTALLA